MLASLRRVTEAGLRESQTDFALVLLLVWRFIFSGLGCFHAPSGECSRPRNAFAGFNALIGIASGGVALGAILWIVATRRHRRLRERS